MRKHEHFGPQPESEFAKYDGRAPHDPFAGHTMDNHIGGGFGEEDVSHPGPEEHPSHGGYNPHDDPVAGKQNPADHLLHRAHGGNPDHPHHRGLGAKRG